MNVRTRHLRIHALSCRNSQSIKGIFELQLLAAAPKAWPSGSIKGLRARSGLTVNLAWTDIRLTQAHFRM